MARCHDEHLGPLPVPSVSRQQLEATASAAAAYVRELQERICSALEALEVGVGSAARFRFDAWQRPGAAAGARVF